MLGEACGCTDSQSHHDNEHIFATKNEKKKENKGLLLTSYTSQLNKSRGIT